MLCHKQDEERYLWIIGDICKCRVCDLTRQRYFGNEFLTTVHVHTFQLQWAVIRVQVFNIDIHR